MLSPSKLKTEIAPMLTSMGECIECVDTHILPTITNLSSLTTTTNVFLHK